jgi:hypothetical protein
VIRLRGHHLLCLQTYKGLGYSEGFVRGMDAIAERLNAGETVEIVEGPDDICAGWAHDPANHCDAARAAARDASALAAFSQMLGSPIAPGVRIPEAGRLIASARPMFASGELRAGCAQCPWIETCDGIAAEGFAGARLS